MRIAQWLIILALTSMIMSPLFQQATALPPYTFTGPTVIDRALGLDLLPVATQARNGTIWLAWQSFRYTPGRPDVVYKTFSGAVNSTVQRLTSMNENTSPAIVQLTNGSIFLFWTQRTTGIPNSSVYYRRFNANPPGLGPWSASVKVTTSAFNDTAPSAAAGQDGTLWLVWQRTNATCTATCTEVRHLYYKTLTGNAWSQETKLTNDTNWNSSPSTMVAKDGRVWVAWVKGAPSSGFSGLYSKTYNGTTWGPDVQLTPITGTDGRASIMQDREGSMWLFWGRGLDSPTTPYSVLYNKFSTDNGAAWSADNLMSSETAGRTSEQPGAVQSGMGADKAIRVFYVSSREFDFDIWLFKSPSISPIHDIKISPPIYPSSTLVYPGGMASVGQSTWVNFTVTVSNLGDSAETVSVTGKVSNTTTYNLGVKTGSVTLGGTLLLRFDWNTANLVPAWYNFNVTATITGASETTVNMADNTLVLKKAVHVIPLGDVDQNGAVTLTDVSIFFYNFGFTPATPNRWNPFCDINNNGIIDIIDTGIAVRNFGMRS